MEHLLVAYIEADARGLPFALARFSSLLFLSVVSFLYVCSFFYGPCCL